MSGLGFVLTFCTGQYYIRGQLLFIIYVHTLIVILPLFIPLKGIFICCDTM